MVKIILPNNFGEIAKISYGIGYIKFSAIESAIIELYNGGGAKVTGKFGGKFTSLTLNGSRGKLTLCTQNPQGNSLEAIAVRAGRMKSNEIIWGLTPDHWILKAVFSNIENGFIVEKILTARKK